MLRSLYLSFVWCYSFLLIWSVSYVVFTAELVLVQPHILHIITFIEVIAADRDHSESNVSSACGLVG